jgi:hypothetical protein
MKLVSINRVMTLEREAVRFDGDSNQFVPSAAQAKGKKPGTALQIIQIDQDLRSEVAKGSAGNSGKVGRTSRAQGSRRGSAQTNPPPFASKRRGSSTIGALGRR